MVIGGVAALVLVVDPAGTPRIDAERVGAALGLTHSESRVAAALAEGASVRAIAAARGSKENTVRWLVRQIHAKLGVSRSTDVVCMVLAVAWTGDGRPRRNS